MTDNEKIFHAIADSLSVFPVETMASKLHTIAAMLKYIPTYDQSDAILAAFGVKEDENA